MRKHILDALFPKTRQAVLKACLLHPQRWWYLSDLANFLSVTPSSLQRELASLVACEILESRKDGNRIYYKANPACLGVVELQNLLVKTSGITDILKNSLKKFESSIHVAFIFGSVARGEELSSSDVDLLIVGTLGLQEAAPILKKVEKTIQREVNVILFSHKEFLKKVQRNDAFLKTVLKGKRIFLKGDEHELEALIGQRSP